MTKILYHARSIILICFGSSFCFGQGAAPVLWHFEAQQERGGEATLVFTAALAPGWHIYSQHIRQGGPIPTRFHLDHAENFVPESTMQENGVAHTFYDTLYEMDITWYSNTVSFQQKIRMTGHAEAITGTVEYMTCNDQTCVPAEQQFKIVLRP